MEKPLQLITRALFLILGAGAFSSAAVIYDSGDTAFSPTGVQFGRLGRDGLPSDWSGPKAFPGITGAPTPRNYQSIAVNSGPFSFLQIIFDDPAIALFVSAYLDAYTPVNAPPNFGLDVNYLGDPGLSQPLGVPSFFQIVVAPGTNLVFPINEINPGGGSGTTFHVIVEGFYDQAFNDVPEPSTLVLIGSAFAVIVGSRLRKTPPAARRGGLFLFLMVFALRTASAQNDISPAALQQISELLKEKDARTETQRKIGSKLIYAIKASMGQPLTSTLRALPDATAGMDLRADGALVDVRASVSSDLLSTIGRLGGRVIYASPSRDHIRARIPLAQMQAFAARSDVRSVRPGPRVQTRRMRSSSSFSRQAPFAGPMGAAMFHLASRLGLNFVTGSLTTQGVVSHSANTARTIYGVNGTGVRVGVLSDSAEATPFLIGTGDLPVGTTIVQEIQQGPGNSEGTAMMEIIYDMAPGVQLFFASAFNGPTSYADNIRTLRNTYGCDVIVDDVGYSDESPFQDGVIAQAVNDVTASGAIYLSSAGNSGNITNGNSNTWEGDFVGAPAGTGFLFHNFGGSVFNRLLAPTGAIDLFWSDPMGASTNDYDLFILDASGTTVLAASTTPQNGTQDPFEEVYDPMGFPPNSRVYIVTRTTAQPRALHLDNFFGEPLLLTTSGSTRGHNAAANAVGVAAVAWNVGRMGTRPFTGGAANPTEIFSADGPRRVFYREDGTAITLGNLLFATNGGETLIKPDIAAADATTTRTPGFNPFFGTSAAAPHAAAIAALIKSANPSLTPAQIRSAMNSTALDIRAPGIDRDSGHGIVMAPAAIGRAITLR